MSLHHLTGNQSRLSFRGESKLPENVRPFLVLERVNASLRELRAQCNMIQVSKGDFLEEN